MHTESIIQELNSKFGKKDSFTKEELDSIEDLTISKFSFTDEIMKVDFNDLKYFNNLKEICIEDCMLDKNIFLILLSKEKLFKLSLYNCEINEDIYPIFENIKVKELLLSKTDFDLSHLTGYYNRITLENVNFKRIESYMEILDISNNKIENIDDVVKSNFEEIRISHSQYEKYKNEFNSCGRRFIVMEDNLEFIEKKVGF
ncbi:MAG: hypothetical protein IJ568_00485 [Bacilli bacterium]|nr:hypothetical protein [Bacilli bacterium]